MSLTAALEISDKQDIFRATANTVVTIENCRQRNAEFVGPLCKQLRLALVGKAYSVAPVIRLLLTRRPSDITRFVVSIYINAIDGVSRAGTGSDILAERIERIAPTVAHRNTAPPIVAVVRMFGIGATTFDFRPYAVFGRAGHAVLDVDAVIVAIVAAATHFHAASQEGGIGNNDIAAIATAKPKALSLFLVMLWRWGLLNYQKSAVAVADFVFDARGKGRGMLCHVVSSSKAFGHALGRLPRRQGASIPFLHLYYTTPQNKSEMGVSVTDIAQGAMGR